MRPRRIFRVTRTSTIVALEEAHADETPLPLEEAGVDVDFDVGNLAADDEETAASPPARAPEPTAEVPGPPARSGSAEEMLSTGDTGATQAAERRMPPAERPAPPTGSDRSRRAAPAARDQAATAFRRRRAEVVAAAERDDVDALERLIADYDRQPGIGLAETIELCRSLALPALKSGVVRKVWLRMFRALDKRVSTSPADTAAAVRAVAPVLRATVLWPIPEAERAEAVRLLVAVNPYAAIPKALSEDDRDRLALYPLLYGRREELDRTIGFARKRRRIGRIATLAMKKVSDGVLTLEQVLAVHALLGSDDRFLKTVLEALADHGSYDAATRLFVDAGTDVSAGTLRALVEQFHSSGDIALIERVLARLAAVDGEPAIAAVTTLAARRLGLLSLALARNTARLGRLLEAEGALTLHHDLLALGHAAEARRVLAAHVETNAGAAHRSAKMAERLDTAETALAEWKAAAERWPEPQFRAGVGRSLAAALQLPAAEQILWGLVDTYPEKSGYWRDLARAFQDIGDWDAWSDCLTEARRSNPDDPWIAHAVRWSESERGRIAAIDDDPKAALDDLYSARMLAGRLLVEGRTAEAADLRRAILDRTQDRRDHHHYALALFQSGRFDEAAAEVERCIARFPGEAHLYVKRAQVCERRLDWGRALEAFVQAKALDPTNAEAAPGVARCLAYLGRFGALETWLRRFPAADPKFGWVHTLRAFGAAMAGRPMEAQEALQPLYASFRGLRTEYEAAMRERPSTVWTEDGPRAHPLERSAHCNRRFLEILDLVAQARSVVVVGNAPTLLGTRLGRKIDAHGCVIRLNDFRTIGFEADVGRKTAIWYTRAHRLARPDPASLGAAHILAQNDTINQYPPVAEYLKGRLRVDLPSERATFLPSYALKAIDFATYPKPTTGFRIIQLLDFFFQREFDIAGFDFFKSGGMHYFDVGENRLQVGEMHAVDFERDFVERVLAEGRFLKRL